MKYRIRVSSRARLDIDHVLAWFHRQSATAAGVRWLALIDSAFDTLQHNPERCSLAPEADELGIDVRDLLVGKTGGLRRIIFRINDENVVILRVWHSARRSLQEEDL